MDVATKQALQQEILVSPNSPHPLIRILGTTGAAEDLALSNALAWLPIIDKGLQSLVTDSAIRCSVKDTHFSIRAMRNDTLAKRVAQIGIYERHISYFMANNLRPGSVFFDVGANVGYHTILAGKLLGPEGKVVSFEPHPALRRVLERNVEENCLTNVKIDSRAVGLASGPAQVDTQVADTGTTAVTLDRSAKPSATTVDIRIEALDQVCLDYRLIPRLIKIDVEGMEADVLLGGRQLFSKYRPTITMEYCPINNRRARNRFATALTWLRDVGYHAHFFRSHDIVAIEPIPMEMLIQLGEYWVSEGHAGFMDVVFHRRSVIKQQ